MKDGHWHEGKYHCVYVIDEFMSEDTKKSYCMVGVRDKWVDKAIRVRKFFIVVSSKGSQEFRPKQIKKEMKKKLFDFEGKYPGNPMHFYPLMIPNNGQIELERWGIYA